VWVGRGVGVGGARMLQRDNDKCACPVFWFNDIHSPHVTG
jgi:hypothetical protein